MIRQQQLLMKTEDINLIFTDDAIEELATVAAEVLFYADGFHEVEWLQCF